MSNVVSLAGEQLVNANGAPDFITRVDISQMSDEQLDEMIAGIRNRRMRAFLIYQTTEEQKKEIADAKTAAAVEKQLGMIAKQLDATNKSIDKLETMTHKLRGLRLQASMSAL